MSLARNEDIANLLGDDGRLVDLLTDESMAVDPSRPAVSLPPLSARVLRHAAPRQDAISTESEMSAASITMMHHRISSSRARRHLCASSSYLLLRSSQ